MTEAGALRHIGDLRRALSEEFTPFERTLDKRLSDFGQSWAEDFEEELGRDFADEQQLRAAVRGYVRFALDVAVRQKRFERTLRYDVGTYSQVIERVYNDHDYMTTEYLPGVLLSNYLWPHHYRHLLFFRDQFVPFVRTRDSFLDIGVGTGFFSKELLSAAPGIRGIGLDISEAALDYARELVARWGARDRYEARLADITADTNVATAPVLICIEVLEHLEDPPSFLRAISRLLRPGGVAFVTAAMTAPEADHVYLYRERGEIRAHLREAGLRPVREFEQAAYEASYEGQLLPRVAAFIVEQAE